MMKSIWTGNSSVRSLRSVYIHQVQLLRSVYIHQVQLLTFCDGDIFYLSLSLNESKIFTFQQNKWEARTD